jgi:hypothetical protein
MKHLAWIALLAACGGNTAKTTPDAAPAPDAAPDAGPFVEAPHGSVPQVESAGGAVLATPKVVPIFFTGDSTMQTSMEPFLQMLVGSSYWTTTTSEYGVGALQVEPTIVTTDTPPTTDDALQTWLQSQLDGTHAGWTYDPQTIYAVYLPDGVSLSTPFGDSCKAFGGYHDETMGAGGKIVYALMPRCPGGLDSLTVVTSHELIEAATDPHPETDGAYQLLDQDHLVWEYAPGGELGDMCEYVGMAEQKLVGDYLVQRTWSNASVAAGHDPCVPVLSTPYQSAAPMLTEDDPLPVDSGAGSGSDAMPMMTKGVAIPVGTSKTIDIALYGDAPGADWHVKAFDATQLYGQPTELTFSWDATTGNNGTILHLTITHVASPGGGSEFLISSRPGDGSISDSIWFGYVAD